MAGQTDIDPERNSTDNCSNERQEREMALGCISEYKSSVLWKAGAGSSADRGIKESDIA